MGRIWIDLRSRHNITPTQQFNANVSLRHSLVPTSQCHRSHARRVFKRRSCVNYDAHKYLLVWCSALLLWRAASPHGIASTSVYSAATVRPDTASSANWTADWLCSDSVWCVTIQSDSNVLAHLWRHHYYSRRSNRSHVLGVCPRILMLLRVTRTRLKRAMHNKEVCFVYWNLKILVPQDTPVSAWGRNLATITVHVFLFQTIRDS